MDEQITHSNLGLHFEILKIKALFYFQLLIFMRLHFWLFQHNGKLQNLIIVHWLAHHFIDITLLRVTLCNQNIKKTNN